MEGELDGPTAARIRALRPKPELKFGASLNRHVHYHCRRSYRHAARPPGTILPSRCRTGTSSNSPSPTSSLISASPGNRRLSQETVQPLSSRGSALQRRRSPQLQLHNA